MNRRMIPFVCGVLFASSMRLEAARPAFYLPGRLLAAPGPVCNTYHAASPTVDALEASLAARDAAIDAEWLAVPDKTAFVAKRAAFKMNFRRVIGYDEIQRTPLRAKKTGVKDHGAFRIEKVILESAPGAYIAALVFLPDAAKFKPPYAGYMFIPGHSDTGKAAPRYLQSCELGARNGLASIIYDPLGQGERSQGAGLRNVDEHVRIGAYAVLLGETTATYMLRDAVRVFDYFESRPDIDRNRLGVCGNSGGGTMATFFMAADDRVKAAAPSCYLSSAREHLLACGPQDAEQHFFDKFAWGFNHAAFIFAAECPVLINAAVEDFFQIEGSRSTHRLVKEVAAKVGLPADWYELSEAPGPHAMSKIHRERSVSFMLKHLKGESRQVAETETAEFTADDYTVTPGGEVSRLAGFKSIYDTIAEKFVVCGVSVDNAARNAKPLVAQERAGKDCRGVLATLKGELVKDKRATLHLGGQAGAGEVTATLFADAGRYVIRPKRKGKRSYYERRKDDEVVAVDLYIAGRSLVALRAAEILMLAAELEKRTGVKPALVAEGRYVTIAKFALAADPTAFAKVEYRNEPQSFLDSLKAREYLSFADSGAMKAVKSVGDRGVVLGFLPHEGTKSTKGFWGQGSVFWNHREHRGHRVFGEGIARVFHTKAQMAQSFWGGHCSVFSHEGTKGTKGFWGVWQGPDLFNHGIH